MNASSLSNRRRMQAMHVIQNFLVVTLKRKTDKINFNSTFIVPSIQSIVSAYATTCCVGRHHLNLKAEAPGVLASLLCATFWCLIPKCSPHLFWLPCALASQFGPSSTGTVVWRAPGWSVQPNPRTYSSFLPFRPLSDISITVHLGLWFAWSWTF